MTRLVTLILSVLVAMAAGLPAAAQTAWPDARPDAFIMAHVDVETTGLDPAFHEMTDIGMIYTDVEGRELGRLYVRIMPPHPERIDPGARAVNGFDVAYWTANGAVTETEATARILAFHREISAGRTVMFTAYNAWFDQGFLSAILARNGAAWRDLFHYHVLDIPSMAWGQGLRQTRGSGVAAALGVPEETRIPLDHTGITGAEFNVSIYRALLTRRGD
jgi:oligoribonuclease (3'-5' exoribonuclease)